MTLGTATAPARVADGFSSGGRAEQDRAGGHDEGEPTERHRGPSDARARDGIAVRDHERCRFGALLGGTGMALGHVGEAIEVEAEMLDRLGHADGHRCIRLEARAEPAVDQLGSYGARGSDEHQGDAGRVKAFDQLGEDLDGRDVDVGDRRGNRRRPHADQGAP